ncbi:MAG: ATP-NAD kinase family protein [Candidatus Thorarchaeota archaeon]|nr:MAG: ATP-NAD kinase [Candidatus Thorarchaeota archaeon]RLI58525.1 MAG: ATP-NAD kinase [Candidatus Thorarchaeota archaeon]
MRVGLLVNPIAGMGGRVGLKGTDGVVEEAIRRGATPIAHGRAVEFLKALKSSNTELIACPGKMGAECAAEAGIDFETISISIGDKTGPEDTRACVRALYGTGVRFIVFVGGDGTARDILDAVNQYGLEDLLVLGVPSGVKMYSGIFVVNPTDAADVIELARQGKALPAEFEVMDADEDAIREDRFIIRLYGYLKAPAVPARFQGSKQASPETIDEHEAQEAIARYVIEKIGEGGTFILGPGTTVKTVADLLGVKKTTLGVDLLIDGEIVNDVSEMQILERVSDFENAWIVVSPIGHQGMLFGRGNQQISPRVIEAVGRDHILVICTPSKLKGIEGGTLKVDTGDPRVDEMLRGYIRVITDYAEIRLVKVE